MSGKLVGWLSYVFIFVVLYGVFWLAENYFSLFEKYFHLNTFSQYSFYIIAGLMVVVVTTIVFILIKRTQIKRLNLITFSVKMNLDKSYRFVQAPSGMSASEFLKLYFSHLMRGRHKERYQAILNKNFPMLEINRNNELINVDGNSTLLSAGLKDGDICHVVGKPK